MGKDGSIPDEEWDRFLREAAAGSADAPQEPSARARMVARRLSEEPGPPDGWRTHRPVPRRRLRGWYVVGLVAALALLAVALVGPGRVLDLLAGDDGATPLAAETGRPDRPEADTAAQRATPSAPFRGSPAEQWADGAAGIHLPAARATGWMSREQVAGALRTSRDFLAASSLDRGVLLGAYPRKAVAALNPRQQDVRAYLAAAFRTPRTEPLAKENDPLLLFSRFEKDKVRLVGDVVKARGHLAFREGRLGAVEVTADVTYVYPVARAAPGSDEVVRTIVRRETVMSWDDPAKVEIDGGTFSLSSYKVDTTNGGCDRARTGYFAPEFGAERSGSGGGPVVDPYDRSTSMDARMREAGDARCGTASRS
ncbi:hypothetical protein ACFYVL_28415 [Streptomyces sp. NPDC004111]|uniref:hypothetical protein n=1 Tax=Streptomyces sp. NPDC004111 TaxID=3364690 RepID=UPI00368C7E45